MMAGGGFAVMAWRLAQTRVWGVATFDTPPMRRSAALLVPEGASAEFYRITDVAAAHMASPFIRGLVGRVIL